MTKWSCRDGKPTQFLKKQAMEICHHINKLMKNIIYQMIQKKHLQNPIPIHHLKKNKKKPLSKVRLEGNFLKLINDIYKKPTANNYHTTT